MSGWIGERGRRDLAALTGARAGDRQDEAEGLPQKCVASAQSGGNEGYLNSLPLVSLRMESTAVPRNRPSLKAARASLASASG